MGFNKRYITKDILLSNILTLDKLFKADALIMDNFSRKFYQDLNREERKLREKIKAEQKTGCPDKHSDYSKLSSLSETLISLSKEPSWLDIHFVQEKLGRFQLEIDEFGNLEKLKEKAIKAIITYYES